MLPSTMVRRSRRLPEPLSPLVGRTSAIATVLSLLTAPDRSIVTITGPGGVGKTRLALRVGAIAREHFRDGVIFVPLASGRGEDAVLGAIGQALDLHETADLPLFDRIVDDLASLEILLLLDNFEHLLFEAEIVDRLVRSLPALHVLLTSQTRLNLSAERIYSLSPLDLPPPGERSIDQLAAAESVQLFLDRARAVEPEFELTDGNVTNVVEICRMLDGLPLAIELAAARIGILPPDALRTRLSTSFFDTLRRGNRDLPDRHRALDAAIGWSFDLLSDSEQELLQRLSVFAGGFPLPAVEAAWTAMGRANGDGIEVLSSLAEKNLLRLLGTVAGEPRYLMLETIRLFARDELRAAGREDDACRAHARWCLTRAGQPDAGLDHDAHAAWLDRLSAEHENFRAALGWSVANDAGIALRLANSLWLFWYVQGHMVEGRRWMQRAVDAGADADPEAQALALNNLGNLEYELGELHRAEEAYTRSRAMWEAAGDEVGVADILNNLGMLATARGDTVTALEVLLKSLEMHRRLEDLAGVVPSLNNLGDVAIAEGDGDAAWRWNEEALRLSLDLGSARRAAHSTLNLGIAQRCRGDEAAAVPLLERSLKMFQDAQDQSGVAIALQQLARASIRRGDTGAGATHLGRALMLHRRVLDRRGLVLCLESAALLASRRSDHSSCASLVGAASRLRGQLRPLQPPADAKDVEAAVDASRRALGDSAFESARVAGGTLSRDDAISCALTVLEAPPTAETVLTRRELEVLRLVAHGASNQEIADVLFISLRTVKAHMTNIFTKLDLSSRAAAVAYAYQHDLA